MKPQTLVLLILTVLGCGSGININSDPLAFIDHVNKLTMIFQNDRCGEWGGDRQTILIYRNDYQGTVYADYTLEKPDCEKPYSEKDIKRTKKNKIKLTAEDKQKVLESINQLYLGKLSREDYPAHSGYSSQVLLSDSSMIINDFPSIRWTKFEELAQRLNNK